MPFFEALQPQNVPFMLLFFMKHVDLLTAKITDSNKSYFYMV